MAVLDQINPREVFHFFEELSAIPRGTFDTKRVSDYCADFAKARGLRYVQDEVNNVIIWKPGTAGYEESEPVILQGHLDMVCEKTEDSTHDFKTDGIELLVEDGYVTANGTTLGGDDGIAIAYALAVLDSSDIPHPPIEAIFTVDEEIGMGGASAIDLSDIRGKMLLNLDSDNEGVILAGCSGGFADTVTIPVSRIFRTGSVATVQIKGLRGGHSGLEIGEQRGNANKMAGRLLNRLYRTTDIALISADGGALENVITPACTVKFLTANAEEAISQIKEMEENWIFEFAGDEPGLQVLVEVTDGTESVMDPDSTRKVIHFLCNSPYGVQGLSRSLKGLVESSLNCGVIRTTEDTFSALMYVRSSVDSKMDEIHESLCCFADILGATCEKSNAYPAWQYKADSRIRPIVMDTYEKMFGKKPVLTTVHAGLECGLLSGKKPDLDCVSFGPEMIDIHSVYEKLDIASTERMWEFLKEILKNCK